MKDPEISAGREDVGQAPVSNDGLADSARPVADSLGDMMCETEEETIPEGTRPKPVSCCSTKDIAGQIDNQSDQVGRVQSARGVDAQEQTCGDSVPPPRLRRLSSMDLPIEQLVERHRQRLQLRRSDVQRRRSAHGGLTPKERSRANGAPIDDGHLLSPEPLEGTESMMQQLLWVMEKLQDDLLREEDLKRRTAELADDFRSAVDVLQKHLSQAVSEAEERDRDIEDLSQFLNRRLADKARQDETIASIDQAVMHVQAQIELVGARCRSSSGNNLAGEGSPPSPSSPTKASIFPFAFTGVGAQVATAQNAKLDAELEALGAELEELAIAREENSRQILAAASFTPQRRFTARESDEGPQQSPQGCIGDSHPEERIDEDLPLSINADGTSDMLASAKDRAEDDGLAESAAASGGIAGGIMNGAWLQRLGAGLAPAGRWLQAGASKQQR